ncbi:MAG: hypothetical protein AAGG44_20875 [Planctomycetota bacterium]
MFDQTVYDGNALGGVLLMMFATLLGVMGIRNRLDEWAFFTAQEEDGLIALLDAGLSQIGSAGLFRG